MGRVPSVFNEDVLLAMEQRLKTLQRQRIKTDRVPSAAVVIPFCNLDGKASVLFTKRSEQVGTHKGQVSFPGGKRDAVDVSHEDTALREFSEELGCDRERVRLLGRFHEVRAITGLRVVPVVGFLGDIDGANTFSHSAFEIDEVFTLTLDDLVNPEKRKVESFGSRGTLPVFLGGPWPVWGLTAYLLDQTIQALFDVTVSGTALLEVNPRTDRTS